MDQNTSGAASETGRQVLESEERVCFWCEDPFRGEKPVVLERTVIDNSGCHLEETWFHLKCAHWAAAELTEALCKALQEAEEEEDNVQFPTSAGH
jgi:hypothetical protein